MRRPLLFFTFSLLGTGVFCARSGPPVENAANGFVSYLSDAAGVPTQNVRTEATGTIIRIYAKVGQKVKAGDILAEMDSDQQLYQMSISKAQAEAEGGLQTAEGQLAQRKADLEEAEDLYRRRQVAKYRVDSAKAWVDWAQGQVKSIREQKEFQKISYDFWTREYEKRFVRCPFNGVITETKVGEGQGVGIAAHVFTVNNPDAMVFAVSIPAQMAEDLETGVHVNVRPKDGRALASASVQDVLTDPADNTKRIVHLIYENTNGQKLAPNNFEVFLPKPEEPDAPLKNSVSSLPR